MRSAKMFCLSKYLKPSVYLFNRKNQRKVEENERSKRFFFFFLKKILMLFFFSCKIISNLIRVGEIGALLLYCNQKIVKDRNLIELSVW
jgi:hypothetical protein